MWGFPSLLAPESQVAKYRRYRKIGKELHAALAQLPWYDKCIQTAITHLGYRDSRGMILPPPDEAAMATVFDYSQREVYEDGQNYLEFCRDSIASFTTEEAELVDAHIRGEAAVYRIVETQPDLSHAILEDINEPGQRVVLTDVTMSQLHTQIDISSVLLFLRPVSLPDFTMTSGFTCLFSRDQERALLKLWGKYDGSVRFAQIARHHKTKGIPAGFRDLPVE